MKETRAYSASKRSKNSANYKKCICYKWFGIIGWSSAHRNYPRGTKTKVLKILSPFPRIKYFRPNYMNIFIIKKVNILAYLTNFTFSFDYRSLCDIVVVVVLVVSSCNSSSSSTRVVQTTTTNRRLASAATSVVRLQGEC